MTNTTKVENALAVLDADAAVIRTDSGYYLPRIVINGNNIMAVQGSEDDEYATADEAMSEALEILAEHQLRARMFLEDYGNE